METKIRKVTEGKWMVYTLLNKDKRDDFKNRNVVEVVGSKDMAEDIKERMVQENGKNKL